MLRQACCGTQKSSRGKTPAGKDIESLKRKKNKTQVRLFGAGQKLGDGRVRLLVLMSHCTGIPGFLKCPSFLVVKVLFHAWRDAAATAPGVCSCPV